VIGELVSRPYVRMTIQMVEDFNGVIEETPSGGFVAKPVTGDGFVPTGAWARAVARWSLAAAAAAAAASLSKQSLLALMAIICG
jgi:5-enolpyruvylshikimate-3-phosphate synthase